MKVNNQAALSDKPMKIKKSKFDMDNFQMWTLAIIPILLVFVFCYIPMGGIIIAFKDYNYTGGIFGSPWVGFKNFEFMLTTNTFTRIATNTIVMNFVIILCSTVCSVFIALLLFQIQSRNSTKLYQTVMITPHFLSWVVVSYMAYALLHPTNGTLNQMLEGLGMKPVDWYSEPNAWPPILTIASVWKHLGMDSLIYYATLMGVDISLVEAAKVDGANKFQVNRYIMIPMLAGIMTIQIILKIGGIFRADFGLFYQVPRNIGALYRTTDVIDTYIFRAMRVSGDMGTSSATGLLQSIVGFVLVVFTNWIVGKFDEEKQLF